MFAITFESEICINLIIYFQLHFEIITTFIIRNLDITYKILL